MRCIKAFFLNLIYYLLMDNCKLIHQMKRDGDGFQANLLLEKASREYVLDVKIGNETGTVPTETELLKQLVALRNYYQSLITPPIVAAPQVEFVEESEKLENKRSAPGLGKLNGRTRLKIQASGEAMIVGQLFRQLYPRQTYGVPRFSAESGLGKKIRQLFKGSVYS
jgi:hypothetical protein